MVGLKLYHLHLFLLHLGVYNRIMVGLKLIVCFFNMTSILVYNRIMVGLKLVGLTNNTRLKAWFIIESWWD